MIPEYLKGKSAIEICNKMRYNEFIGVGIVFDGDTAMQKYLERLEMLLLLAVKDALMNADNISYLDVRGIVNYGLLGNEAEGRAIAFLNQVLPYENKT